MPSDGFGARLKELRESQGLTQPDLAGRAGLTKAGIANLEQGRREPSWATVQALAAALGVSCEEFTRPPAEREPAGPGRPPKARDEDEAGKPKRPRGRPRKETS